MGKPALILAAERGNLEILRELLTIGNIDINKKAV